MSTRQTAERLAQLKQWLHAQASDSQVRLTFDPASLQLASADASARRYFRVVSSSEPCGSLIVMDAPPPGKCREFVLVATLMANAGLNVPRIFAHDLKQGFMLLSDLGNINYLDRLNAYSTSDEITKKNAQPLLLDAIDTLITWQQATQIGMLPDYDAALLRQELALFSDWYLGRHLQQDTQTSEQRVALEQIFSLLIKNALAQPKVFVHRDFMPRNLMVAAPKPGVLDFQDAVHGPLTYDVVSLFRDAFISWEEAFERECVTRYWERARQAGLPVHNDFSEFYRDYEWMGLQRHLKILGIFARLNYRDQKPRYLADAPRFIGYVHRVAQRYREFAPLTHLLDPLYQPC